MDLLDAARNINKTHENDRLARLLTPWGEQLDPKQVLPEYPRPQLRRAGCINLNGLWDYRISPSPEPPDRFDGQIVVPFSPESLLSGVERQLKPGEYLFYRRPLPISPSPYPGGRLLLHFGAVDQTASVYLNGRKVTEHTGGYLPFSADITGFLTEADNLLLVRVEDATDTSFHARGKQTLKRGGMFYTAQSGIWQTVWMEWVPPVSVGKLRITPDYDANAVEVRIYPAVCPETGPDGLRVNHPLSGGASAGETAPLSSHTLSVAVEERSGEKKETLAEAVLHIPCPLPKNGGEEGFCVRLTLPFRHDWTPDDPHLFSLLIRLDEDEVESYFAIRSFTIEKDDRQLPRFCLNHRPLFLNGVLDQGYWPDGLYTAPSDDALIHDILTMKKYGFNMMRKHIKIEAARWYYHCDRLGMIVCQDMVSGGSRYSLPLVCYLPTLFPRAAGKLRDNNYKRFSRESAEGRREWTAECAETVDYLYNTPSIAVWVPFNEGWGQFDALKAAELIRQKDPTRLIDHASGWFDQGGGDFKSEHNYFRKLEVPPDSRAYFLSEYGGYACHIPGHSSVERIYGYRKFDTPSELAKAYRELMETVNSLVPKGLCAAVYTQVSDVEEEVNGLLTYDRRVCKLPFPDSSGD